MNALQERQLAGLPIPTDLPVPLPIPLPTKKPDTSSSSSAVSSTSAASSTSLSSTSSSSSISSTSSTPTSSSSSSTVSPTSALPSPSSDSVLSTSTHTVTALPDIPSNTPSASPSPTSSSFLQNKVLSGVVFTIVGIIGLTILVMIATLAIRRSRKKRLLNEAVSFDPVNFDANYHDSLENGQLTKSKSRTSTSTGFGSSWSHGPEVRNAPAFDSPPSLPSYNMANAPFYQQGQAGYYGNAQQQGNPSFQWALPSQHNSSVRLSPVEEVEHSRRSRSSSGEIKFAPSAPTVTRPYPGY
ncbi:hypothetical protein CVT26_000222 [Gymnopilus dilepis]|uniref:Uncharacterized protein n=1 Tax=Gymnopilus dilepis TaxID=231916 RepID=A0A409VG82_9AGAR|nr:hypothetical protein CVT26_000222 [Gymnopilus dilepis]